MRWPPRIAEPFYADDRVCLFHANAFELLPLLPVVDAIVVDAPYSAKTHSGHNRGTNDANKGTWKRPSDGITVPLRKRQKLDYAPWTPADVAQAAALSAPRCRGWYVTITDHVLAGPWAASLEMTKRVTFAPLPFVERGAGVRMVGDGPSSWTRQIVVARPRNKAFAKWGTLDGAYIMPPGVDVGEEVRCTGGKPVWLLDALIRDYTKPDDVVLDYCAGWGTCGVSAKRMGRRAILVEMDVEACAKAADRLARTKVQERFPVAERLPAPEQLALVGGG